MASVKNVANFFVDLAQKQNEADMGDLITNVRLQKLLYFAQGCSLARYGKPLFCAPIEAWNYGPVVPEVYRRYKVFGRQGIVTSDHPADDAFTPEEQDLLLDVAREYDRYSTPELVNLTHAADAPWSRTQQSDEIHCSALQHYFSAQKPLPSFDDILDVYPVEVL